jgi:hypothetical protein
VDHDGVPAGGFAQYSPVVMAVVVVEEDGAAVDPTLRHVERDAGDFQAGQARQGGRAAGRQE